MVKDRDFHYLPFIGNALGYGYVLMAWFRIARRVVMGKDNSGGIVAQGVFQNVPAFGNAGVNRTFAKGLHSNQLILCCKVDGTEFFLRSEPHVFHEIRGNIFGTAEIGGIELH